MLERKLPNDTGQKQMILDGWNMGRAMLGLSVKWVAECDLSQYVQYVVGYHVLEIEYLASLCESIKFILQNAHLAINKMLEILNRGLRESVG